MNRVWGPDALATRLSYLAAGSLTQKQVLVHLLIGTCTIVLLVHLPALSTRAIFHDDTAYVLENPLVQNPSWGSVKRFFGEVGKPSTVRGYYQPLTMTSLMLDRLVAKTNQAVKAKKQATDEARLTVEEEQREVPDANDTVSAQ